MNYKDSGVNTQLADSLVNNFLSDYSDQVGKFAARLNTRVRSYSDNLVASVDGVGTKVLLAKEFKNKTGYPLNNIGKDCVAMVMNDIICEYASPMMFMDYYATGKLNESDFTEVLTGMKEYCDILKVPILGGETAELPGMFKDDAFDVCGFGLGCKLSEYEFDNIVSGDSVIGLKSSGVHSNGFSLIRNILNKSPVDDNFIKTLLEPTRLYYHDMYSFIHNNIKIKGIINVTGGGWSNIDRVVPRDRIEWWYDPDSYYSLNKLFRWIQKEGDISVEEMYNTFNCGIGMIFITETIPPEIIPVDNSIVLGRINK